MVLDERKTILTLLIVIFVAMCCMFFYIRWNNSINDEKLLKQANLQKEESQKIIEESTATIKNENLELKKTNQKLDSLLKLEQSKPPVKIPVPYEVPIYIYIDDNGIIKSFTKSAKRYRKIRQEQLENIK